jgi:hypothetical protein
MHKVKMVKSDNIESLELKVNEAIHNITTGGTGSLEDVKYQHCESHGREYYSAMVIYFAGAHR